MEVVAAFVGAISAGEPRNWDLCKENQLWGVPGPRPRAHGVDVGDRIFIWKGRAGFIAEVVVTGPARIPEVKVDAPWPGGVGRFRLVFPIQVVREIREAYKLGFVGDRQAVTGISSNSLRFGLVPISDQAANELSAAIAEREPITES